MNIFVPGAFSVPTALYQSAPLFTMCGTFINVSTLLLMTVGDSYRPSTAGNGGRRRGWPRNPSRLESRAVSSPKPARGLAAHHRVLGADAQDASVADIEPLIEQRRQLSQHRLHPQTTFSTVDSLNGAVDADC